ncbi:MAG: metal ABC transporter substrate-binding protein [Phototrophicaceae bacterium]
MRKSWCLFLSVIAMLASHSVILAQTEPLEVVASFSILADVVAQVAGEHATVTTVMPIGADPHSFEPTPRALTALSSADVVFTNGIHFEENLLPIISNTTTAPMVEVSRCVFVREFGLDDHHEHEEEEHDHEATHDESCDALYAELATLATGFTPAEEAVMASTCEVEEEADHEDSDHAHAGCDPHVWQNPYNVMVWTITVRDTLIELDPAHADAYASNAQAYLAELNALVTEFILPTLDTLPTEQRLLVTNHETMGYFAEAFGFRMIATVLQGNTTGADSSLQDLAGLVDQLKQAGVVALFAETSTSDGVIQQLAQEINVPVATLYTDSLSESNEVAPTYLAFMRYNVGTIVETLAHTTP